MVPGSSENSGADRKDIILVEDLTVAYGEETVLENVGFAVAEGEILAVLGESGCGKTTLLRALTGLVTPTRGRVTLAGEVITADIDREALARARMHIGVLFQSGALINSLTVAENVALPLLEFTNLPREMINEMVQLKLDMVRLGESGKLMPAELSGGMRKRAALARSLSLDPQILFCDEPSSGLDPVTAKEIDELLLELNRFVGVTVVVITHEIASIRNLSSYCIMLDKDRKGIIAEGTSESLMHGSDNPSVRKFFQREIGDRPAGGSP